MWAYVDSALNTNKRNGRSSSGYAVMVGNIPVVDKAQMQTSVEKSTHGGEFVACNSVVDEVLRVRDMLRSMGYIVNRPSRIFYDNKGVVLAACGAYMLIKKRSTALAFHRTKEAIASGAVELQHISGDKN